jgi:hypothetical protein
MAENESPIETLYHRTEEYAKTSFELLKLTTIEKTTAVASSIVGSFIVIAVVFMFLFFLSAGFSIWLGSMFEHKYYGFFIVSAFYAVAGIVIYFFFYKRIKKRINDSLIKDALKS